ncbi:MAG: dynamin family protein [Desulfosarcina sp.]
MPTYETLKQQLAKIGEETALLLDDVEKIAEWSDEGLSQWKIACRTLSEQISKNTMRVAVVGAIKSGKSTLVNTLFEGDHLKRGAGVVTSIVTRVRTGSRLKAVLYLKNWDEVNRDIEQASVLLPVDNRPAQDRSTDIRRESDRRRLELALDELAAEHLIANDTRSAGSVLLASYLGGYDRLRQVVEDDHAIAVYEGGRFPLHRDFVGDDAMAVYLKDVLLEIDATGLGQDVEIADCQGSDSPNPLHLAMIQDYLMIAHLTIYVISSRTGLRQADIRFLSMIRKMGILDTVVFVVNCDFSEHESLRDLSEGIRKIEADLSLIRPDPGVFTFSALLLLMSQTESDLSEKDRERLAMWRRETDMVDFAAAEQTRFRRYLEQKLGRERYSLLLKNHLERLETMADGIGGWIGFNRDLLSRDTGDARELAERIHRQVDRTQRLRSTVKNTLDGAVGQVKLDLKNAVDRFFDEHSHGVVDDVVRFVRGYRVEMQRYDENLAAAGFAKTLYLVFQEFKQAVDAHMAESVNPQIMRFVKAQEKYLVDYLDEIAGPHGAVIEDALTPEPGAMDDVITAQRRAASRIRVGVDAEALRKMSGLSLPPAAATMHYSTQIKTEAVMRFGFYRIVNRIKKVFNQSADKALRESSLALASGIKRMKRETERSILFNLKDYKENLKFQYLLKLADAAADALQRQMRERFHLHGADLAGLAERVGENRLDKEEAISALDRMGETAANLREKIGRLKIDLQHMDA